MASLDDAVFNIAYKVNLYVILQLQVNSGTPDIKASKNKYDMPLVRNKIGHWQVHRCWDKRTSLLIYIFKRIHNGLNVPVFEKQNALYIKYTK